MQSLVFERIERDLNNSDIVLYMKGTAVFPQCGFSAAIVQILTRLNVPFNDIDILDDTDLHQAIKEYADWPRTPQLYVKGKFVGGCDVIREIFANGELEELLMHHGIIRNSGCVVA
jgi:monothiol glutaredoxin